MIKIYEQPIVEVITFGQADVLTFSGGEGDKAASDLDWE